MQAALSIERDLLAKAETDLAQGRLRLRSQQAMLAVLRSGGLDCKEVERLTEVTGQMLVQWERHRSLIEQRILFLERTGTYLDR